MTWPPPTSAQTDGPGNMAGFGARRMQEEQQREADRRQQEWEQAEAARRYADLLQQQEQDRHFVEQEKQCLAWEWAELQRQQQEHEAARAQFQHEQAYLAEQQRLQYEQEQQRLYQLQQQQFQEQQQRIERQQEELQRQQSEMQKQQQLQQEALAEQERNIKKAQVELQRKARSQAAAAQQLEEQQRQQQQRAQEQLQQQEEQQRRLQQEQQEQQELLKQQELLQTQMRRIDRDNGEVGDETLQAVPDSPSRDTPPRKLEPRPKKSTRNLRQRTPSTVKRSEARTKAWAAEHAEPLLVFCGDCQVDIPLSLMDTHPCMRRTHSGSTLESSGSGKVGGEASNSAAYKATSLRLAVQTRSPLLERHLELERGRNATNSPLSPSLSPMWPDSHSMARSHSQEGGAGVGGSSMQPPILRTPSEDERERLISTPSPIPPDLSPEEEAAIRSERKRRIEAQREAKKKGSAAVAATAIIAALKFDGIARTVGSSGDGSALGGGEGGGTKQPRSSSPSSIHARTGENAARVGLPLDKFPSNSSLASTQSSLLSSAAAATRRPYNQRDRAYSGSSAVVTPSTSYEFSHGGVASGSSPDLLSTSTKAGNEAAGLRLRANSSASYKMGGGGGGAAATSDSSGDGRHRMNSADSMNAAASSASSGLRLRVDTGNLDGGYSSNGSAGRNRSLGMVDERSALNVASPSSPYLGASSSKVARSRSPSDVGKTGNSFNHDGHAGISASSSPGKTGSSATLHPSDSADFWVGSSHAAGNSSSSRNRSNSLSPLSASSAALRRPSMDRDADNASSTSSSSSRKNTTAAAAAAAAAVPRTVDLRGIEDLMRGLETDEVLESLKQRRRERERTKSEAGRRTQGGAATASVSGSTSAATAGMSPQMKARMGGGGASGRPAIPTIKPNDRARS
ncbi:hypothetical protein V8E36_002537 [Tilletia maclaganii]